MAKTQVVIRDISTDPADRPAFMMDLDRAVEDIFVAFGGGSQLLKSSREVYLKPNAIDAKPFCYTRPEVLEAVIRYFFKVGASDVYVMENSTQGNYTRLVFEAIGYTDICKQTGAMPIFLDEEPTERFEFKGKPPARGKDSTGYDLTKFEMPHTVVKELINRKKENLYVSLPKLKTHSMAGVTLGIKNQWAFPRHQDRKFDHNYNLHSKLVDVLEYVQPDFTLIDGIEGTIHGHYPPTAIADKLVKKFRVLVGGRDVVATDIVGARIFGLTPEDVPHLKIAIERGIGLGVKGLQDIEIIGDLSRFKEKYPTDLYPEFPPDVEIVQGSKQACREGCKNNPLTLLQVLYLDFGGKGGFQLVIGKGHQPTVIDRLKGPVLVAGHCAIEEVGERLQQRLGKNSVYFSDGCNNLAQTAGALLPLMKVSPQQLVPLSMDKATPIILEAIKRGTHAIAPNISTSITKK
ncbi:MAG: DUF362 domain-containing protein [Promethearchaeati archaeon SRVP18_Atabeyarchaeia-1]